MSNMSYCRHENTANDLEDCYERWDDFDPEDSSSHEIRGRKKLLRLCKDIVSDYGDDEE